MSDTAVHEPVHHHGHTHDHAHDHGELLTLEDRHAHEAEVYDAMAEEFEDKEHALFGDDGFDKMVDRVAKLERAVGIYDLNQYTPH